jgi:ribosomal protein S18 acetylase RimI-like enzyme
MKTVGLQDKSRIESFLRKAPDLHVYALGDLDDRFWPRTEWYGLENGQCIETLAVLYHGPTVTNLMALCPEAGTNATAELLTELEPKLPARFYAQLSPGLTGALGKRFKLVSHGMHLKMSLKDPSPMAGAEVSRTVQLAPSDAEELRGFYAESYPGNWFDPWMLETGQYFGLREGGRLAAAAGVHVYSPKTRVAALGNITTHPSCRGRGFGRIVTAAVCRSLLKTVDRIGLNVKADNHVAIRLYEDLGFQKTAAYEEFDAQA